MPRDLSNRTYRVRQLPKHLTKDDIPSHLAECFKELGEAKNIIVYSLAASLLPFENPRTNTATIVFRCLPAIFDNDDTEWILRKPGPEPNIIVDVNFLGFTALNFVEPEVHSLDCISISGLASHPFGSWAERSTTSNFMWLRDRLPRDFERVRSIIYGYDTRLLQSQSFQDIDDLALALHSQLKSIGRGLKSSKPVVFLAHSLGGLVLKKTLLEMANGGDEGEFMLSLVLEVIFLGVPNKGMETSHWLPMVRGQPNSHMVQLLSPNSHFLVDLDTRFSGISMMKNMRLVSFYETGQSRTAEMNISTGRWEMSGPYKVLVTKDSAIQCNSNKSDIVPINKSHSDMVKFSEGNEDYTLLASYIHQLTQNVSKGYQSPTFSTLKQSTAGAFSHALQNVGLDKITEKDEDLILCSLDISDLQSRFQKIEESYEETFGWVWTDPAAGFMSWLRNDMPVYWIAGKPGSGKSTIMKYIYNKYPREPTNPGRAHLRAGFFFHDRGSHLQKSFEGLLYGLVHQILSQERRLIQEVAHIYHSIPKHDRPPQEWPIESLSEALDFIMKQTSIPIDLHLFLDALDEFGGAPSSIVSFVHGLIESCKFSATNIKICFSSRLLNIFVDEFQACPGFRIHEKTHKDIMAYINGKLDSNRSMRQIQDEQDAFYRHEISELKSNLAIRAEGVFLWLKLVIEELLQKCIDGATVDELNEVLDSFPSELEELYVRIVKRIPPKYSFEGYAMLEVILRAEHVMEEYDFWLAVLCASCQKVSECEAKTIVGLPSECLSAAGKKTHVRALVGSKFQRRRRIKSRCGGLIEYFSLPLGDHRGEMVFQFMHQTVKDFVGKSGLRKLMSGGENLSPENGYSFLAKYGISQLNRERRTSVIKQPSILPAWFTYILYASRSEQTTGTSQKILIDSATHAFRPQKYNKELYGLFDSAIEFAVVMNLQIYVDTVLGSNSNILRNKMGRGAVECCSFLHIVVRATLEPAHYTPKLLERFSDIALNDLSGMAQLLLKHNANLNSSFLGRTPFQMLFDNQYYGKQTLDKRLIKIAEVFLLNGQDINTTISVRDNIYSEERVSCKALHIADSKLAEILLNHGASVNELDQNGKTALEIAIEKACKPPSFHSFRREDKEPTLVEESYQLVQLLLNHGGRVSKLKNIDLFLRTISSVYPLHSIDSRITDPDQLEMLLF